MPGMTLESLKKHKSVSTYQSIFFNINIYFLDVMQSTNIYHEGQIRIFVTNSMRFQLIPLFVCLGVGMVGAGFYLTRLAMRSPEVTWHPKKNQEPWEEYKDKTYKVCLYIL